MDFIGGIDVVGALADVVVLQRGRHCRFDACGVFLLIDRLVGVVLLRILVLYEAAWCVLAGARVSAHLGARPEKYFKIHKRRYLKYEVAAR